MTDAYDVAIVGGGLVGASLALALSNARRRVALIEQAPPPRGAPRWDERCIAINAASRDIFASLGVWPEMEAAAALITSTHISEQGRFGVARFTAQEAGLPALGYNVPMRVLGETLWRAVEATSTTLCCPARVGALVPGTEFVALRIEAEAPRELQARLVVAADGVRSPVREMLHIGAETRDYGQSAIVTAVKPTRSHSGCAYERFTPDGPIALLPKPGDDCSLVWTVPTDRVPDMLRWSDDEFLARAQDAFGERLGRFTVLGARAAYPLSRVMSEQLTAPRVLFAGNAAQTLHPVAAQGFNLGLRDVAAVAALVGGREDPGTPELLAQYAASRARDREATADFTDRLVRTFSNRVPGLRGLRHLGILALDLAPPLKQAVMRQNLGFGL